MLCNLKISGRVPKIPIGRMKIKIPIRLKITIISKNCRLKITSLKIYVRVRIYARIYARAYDSGQIVIRTNDHDQHTRGTHTTGTQDHGKTAYIGIFADNEKKV